MLSETRDTLVSAASLDRSSWNPAFLHGLPLVANLQKIPINAMDCRIIINRLIVSFV